MIRHSIFAVDPAMPPGPADQRNLAAPSWRRQED